MENLSQMIAPPSTAPGGRRRGPKGLPKLSSDQATAFREMVRDLRKLLPIKNAEIGEILDEDQNWTHHRLRVGYQLTFRDALRIYDALAAAIAIFQKNDIAQVSPAEARLAQFASGNPWVFGSSGQQWAAMHVAAEDLESLAEGVRARIAASHGLNGIDEGKLQKIERAFVAYFQDGHRRQRMSEALALRLGARLHHRVDELLKTVPLGCPGEPQRLRAILDGLQAEASTMFVDWLVPGEEQPSAMRQRVEHGRTIAQGRYAFVREMAKHGA